MLEFPAIIEQKESSEIPLPKKQLSNPPSRDVMISKSFLLNDEAINMLNFDEVPSNLEPRVSVFENFEEEKKEEIRREHSHEFEYP